MNAYRILVTGSRDWDDVTTIAAALEQTLIDAGPRPVLVAHGACPNGADWHADHYARWLRGKGCNIDVEQHPANWRPGGKFDRGAGYKRNAAMVALGADVCLAFIAPCAQQTCRKAKPHGSHGATHCADAAERAGIPARRWTT